MSVKVNEDIQSTSSSETITHYEKSAESPSGSFRATTCEDNIDQKIRKRKKAID